MMDTMDLSKVGLNEHEQEIVKYLLNVNKASISAISKNVTIPRSSIYRHIDSLDEKGWVKYGMTAKGKVVEITNLSSLQAQVEAKKEQVEAEEVAINDLIESIASSQSSKNAGVQTVRYYEGESGMRQIHWNATYTAKKSIRVITSIITRDLVGDAWYETQLMEAQEKEIPIKILVDQKYARAFFKKYESEEEYYKPLPDMKGQIDKRELKNSRFKVAGKIMIYNNVIAAITSEGGKLMGSEIVSDHLSLTMKSMFDVLWGMTGVEDRLEKNPTELNK